MAHVAPAKKEEVARLVTMLKGGSVVAIANVEGIPANAIQKIRKQLRQDAQIKVSKNTLLTLALKEAEGHHPQLGTLVEKIDGQTALIVTNMSPFKLYRKLESSKSSAPARGGEVAPADIMVKKGDTPFKPGPIVGELQKAGIPAAIDQGKVVIKSDKTVVKAGERIPQELAAALTRLEIFPLIVGVDLKAAYDEGLVYGPDSLSVDYLGKLLQAHQEAVNLAVYAGITEPGTIQMLVGVSHSKALALASVMLEKNPEAVSEAIKAALASRAAAPAADAGESGKEEKKKEKEEQPSEEEAMGGLGSLFG
ncbi:MAG: 50S ribosomal protein L10 [Euryarchaeota archaeon]|nr:50S ribosomal protein L10 [Euryarchaeota archaeon]